MILAMMFVALQRVKHMTAAHHEQRGLLMLGIIRRKEMVYYASSKLKVGLHLSWSICLLMLFSME